MEKKKQTMRFSDEELGLIKRTFADNDDLLVALRKFLLQAPLDEKTETILIGNFKGKNELVGVVRKTILPVIDADAPVNQIIDLHMTLPLKDKDPEQAYPHILVIDNLSDYLDQQLTALEKVGEEVELPIKFSSFSERAEYEQERWVKLLTRNTIIQHIEGNLNQLSVLAGKKEESVEETMERLKKNSSK